MNAGQTAKAGNGLHVSEHATQVGSKRRRSGASNLMLTAADRSESTDLALWFLSESNHHSVARHRRIGAHYFLVGFHQDEPRASQLPLVFTKRSPAR